MPGTLVAGTVTERRGTPVDAVVDVGAVEAIVLLPLVWRPLLLLLLLLASTLLLLLFLYALSLTVEMVRAFDERSERG